MSVRSIVALVTVLLFATLTVHSAAQTPELNLTDSASAYVPMESYVYALFDRLAAMGVIEMEFVGMRPWTRVQCARLVQTSHVQDSDDFASGALRQLRLEFAPELRNGSGRNAFGEVYVRSLTIGGEPLTHYHFGSTIYNDYNRPHAEGENAVLGIAATQVWNKVVFHARGELQHAEAPRAFSTEQQDILNSLDQLPSGTSRLTSGVDRFRFVELYAGVRAKNLNFTVGKQALWWGPSPDSATLFSTNAEPIYMIRIQQDAPIRLPWVFGWLGPMRWDAFFGKLDGHAFPADPFLHGQKLSFRPTRNLELGFSRTVEFAGAGRGLTFGSLWRSLISVGDKPSATPGSSHDVGDRRGGFDFKYRLPGLRDRVTLYGDFFTDDDPSPLASPRRSGMIPGIYVSRLPFFEKIDLRLEAQMTDQSSTSAYGGRFFYFNGGYKDGYTNNGQILGAWVGRDAKAMMANWRYWVSATRDVSLSYRNVKSDSGYLPGGGTQHDVRCTLRSLFRKQFRTDTFVQYEQWKIPVLAPQTSRNVSVGLEIGLSARLAN